MRHDPPALSDEWVGGHFALDTLVTGEGPPYRPSLVVWVDPAGPYALKGQPVRPGEEAAALVRLLADACAAPEVGPPRRPARVRVSDELAARRIRERQGIPAEVGPTPELEDLRRSYAEYQARHGSESDALVDGTYLPAGFSPAQLAELFTHARALYALAPWKHVDDEDVLAVDVPALSVEGAVLSLMGAMDQTLGFALFESAAAFQQFLALNDRESTGGGPVDLGGETLTLTFEPREFLSGRMEDEVAKHRQKSTGGRRFPLVQRRRRDTELLPATAEDLRLASALAAALVNLFREHPSRQGLPATGARLESRPPGGLAVTLSYPHPHLPATAEDDATPELALIDRLFRFGASRFPDAIAQARKAYGLPENVDPIELQLFTPWLAYCYRIRNCEPLAAHFLRERGEQLDAADRAWLQRELAAPLSVWEVEELRRGEGMTLRDLLTGRRCRVLERMGSRNLRLRDGLLARVVAEDGGDTHGLHGLYPLSLGPRPTAAVVAEATRRAGWRSLPVDEHTLAAGQNAALLVRLWREQADALHAAPAPQLCNTDGDPLLMVEDTYGLQGRTRKEVVAALRRAGFEGEGNRLSLSKRKRGGPLDSVLVATIEVHDQRLVIEANSRKRASAAQRKVGAALGGPLPRLRRSETSPPGPGPGDRARAQEDREEAASPDLPPEALEVVRKYKAEHWRRWLDESIPALGGVTPRQAARSPDRREALELLLKEAEHAESSQGETAFDVSILRRELGLT